MNPSLQSFIIGVLLTVVVAGIWLMYTNPDALVDIVCNASSHTSDVCDLQSAS